MKPFEVIVTHDDEVIVDRTTIMADCEKVADREATRLALQADPKINLNEARFYVRPFI